MADQLKTQRPFKSFLLLGAASAMLAGCEGGFQMPSLPSLGNTDAAPATADAASMSLVERDIEAPEVFQVNTPGLWDGRPSLGGVWVAHPDVSDPERVIIRNPANGKFVIGALFRRERENPGPALQVSSDAATELGMLAGSPATLSVTALRREEAAAPTETAITDFDAPEVITAEPLDDAPVSLAAATAADAGPAPTPAALPVTLGASLDKPFIQIGIFTIESNANRTAERLRGDGLTSRVLAQESQGKSFWRVVVGPAPNAGDRAVVLDKVKALGFTDAYAVSN